MVLIFFSVKFKCNAFFFSACFLFELGSKSAYLQSVIIPFVMHLRYLIQNHKSDTKRRLNKKITDPQLSGCSSGPLTSHLMFLFVCLFYFCYIRPRYHSSELEVVFLFFFVFLQETSSPRQSKYYKVSILPCVISENLNCVTDFLNLLYCCMSGLCC